MATEIDTLVIGCMDYRLNDKFDEALGKGNAVALRNAGGDANSLIKSIEDVLETYANVKNIVFYLHDNGCGGMEVAWGANHNDSAYAAYKDRFKPLAPTVKKSRDQKDLEEKENPVAQVELLRAKFAKGFKGRKIEVSDCEPVKVPEKSHKHFLLVTKDLTTSYEKLRVMYRDFDPKDTYIIQYSKDIKEVLDDISIGVKVLGLEVKTLGVSLRDIIAIREVVGTTANVGRVDASRSKSVS